VQEIRSGSLGSHAARLTIHYDNLAGLARPHLRLWQADANTVDLAPTGGDEFGPLWELPLVPPELTFTFTAGPGAAQTDGHDRRVRPPVGADGGLEPGQVWCRGDRAFVYPVRPADPQPEPAAAFLERLAADPGFPAGLELPSAGGRSGFGANLFADGRVLFGLYHPTAARVFVAGSFNDWQYPGQQRPDPDAFVELALFRGWFGAANTWLAVTDRAGAGDGVPVLGAGRHPPRRRRGRLVVDPYARQLGPTPRAATPWWSTRPPSPGATAAGARPTRPTSSSTRYRCTASPTVIPTSGPTSRAASTASLSASAPATSTRSG
jgi:hypothetical protein